MPVCVYNLHTVYMCSASITSTPFLCSRLILIADKDKVYDKFPIPLINRLEKHLVTTSTILLPDQQEALRTLQKWIHGFTKVLGYVCIHIMCLLHVYDKDYLVKSCIALLCILSIDSKKVMHLLDFSHKLQPLWSFKQVNLPVQHRIHGMLMWVFDVSKSDLCYLFIFVFMLRHNNVEGWQCWCDWASSQNPIHLRKRTDRLLLQMNLSHKWGGTRQCIAG